MTEGGDPDKLGRGAVWHHGEACLAALIGGRCWHYQAGVLWAAHHWHADRLPPGASPRLGPAGRRLAGFLRLSRTR
jgi:hypothetical protein